MYSMRRHQPRPKRFKSRLIRFVIYAALIGLAFNYFRPLPHANASIAALDDSPQSVNLDWPAKGSAAIGAKGFGVLETHGSQTPRSMASLAKLITVLAVLEKHPLQKGQQGPSITLSDRDVELFNHYFSIGGAYVKVEKGEKISEYQALEAILLPSANNMADSLALWTFGTLDDYHAYANDMLKRYGLANTVVAADASGMSSASKSTPSDLIKLGELVLQNSMLTEIIKKPNATIPVHGIIYSANARYNFRSKNIFGIKTGLTDEAGGCFLFAADHHDDSGKTVTIIGAITGQPTLREAFAASDPLLTSAQKYFAVKTPIKKGEIFATLTTPWLTSAKVIARQDLTLVSWKGKPVVPHIKLAPINRSLPVGAQVGTAIIASGENTATTPLVLQEAISGPSWGWRIKRF
jgi:serine-type D-Ala-D-Ala carboxypeptidase (penicillin-binding protein 5/6)